MSSNIRTNGINHLALSTNNMKEQIEFFSDVLGMELIALYWMHGTEDCWHGFLRLNDKSALAFVFNPANADAQMQYGVTQPGHMMGPSAPGTMQHVALNVDGMDELLNMRDRIRSRGVNVTGPVNHGFANSLYFQGPEDISLEICTFEGCDTPVGPKDWIDPEVVEIAGISEDELARYIKPAEYAGQGGAVAQPPFDPNGYNPKMPEDMLKGILAMPDEMVTQMLSEPTAPSQMQKT
ncbi:MAG: glyoxalase [Ponticaulis sp.]|nr:glyoxalase [Ponticaulis sp.]